MRSSGLIPGLIVLLQVALPAASSAAPATLNPLEVQLDSGRIVGTESRGRSRAWLGIPYAAPPVGAHRWRPPAAVRAWADLRSMMAPGPICAQPGADATGKFVVVGSEDCLTLNVYAPRGTHARPLPVMVWIHGGGEMYGSGSATDGSTLAAEQNLVIVTINYRLGPFGWFHHPAIARASTKPTTGQFAILDMLAALRWVHRNVGGFGGDPGNVTIIGESAGAQNVYALVLTPKAHGLFHKAIAESGGFWNMTLEQATNFRDDPVPGSPASAREIVNALLIAGHVAANETAARALQRTWSAAALAAWLRHLPTAAVLAPYAQDPHIGYDLPSVVYDGILLPAVDHRTRLARGDYNIVPMLVGGNRDEQKYFLATDKSLLRQSDGHSEIIDPAHYAALNRYYSDWWTFMAVDDLVPRLRAPVYAYRFEWDDEPVGPTDLRSRYGAAHGLEVPFVFGDFRDPEYAPLFTVDNAHGRERLAAAMMSYWAEFARTGDPSRGTSRSLPPWPAWRDSRKRIVFGSSAIRTEPGVIDGARLLEALWASPDLSATEKCTIFLDDTMYPAYPLAALAAHGCGTAPRTE